MGGCVSSHEKYDYPLGMTAMPQPATLPTTYSAKDYAAFVHNAAVLHIDEDAVRALQGCTTEQCREVAAQYEALYSQCLLESLQDHCQVRTAFIALILLRGVCETAAFYLNILLDVMMPKPEITLIELVCGLSEKQLQQTIDCYLELTENDLSAIVKKKCSSYVVEILEYRIEHEPVDDGKPAEQYAKELVLAMETNNLFEGDKAFPNCIKTQPASKLSDIFEHFLKLCQRDMVVEIHKYYPAYPNGHIRDCYATMASIFHNPSLHYAKKIKELLPDTYRDGHMNLLYTVLSLSQKDVMRLKQTFQATYFESLASDIREESPEPFMQRVLLKHIK